MKIIILLSSSKRLTVTARVAGSSFERKLAISSNSSYCIDKKKQDIEILICSYPQYPPAEFTELYTNARFLTLRDKPVVPIYQKR